MSVKKRAQKVRAMIDRQIRVLHTIVRTAARAHDLDYAKEKLVDWRARTAQLLSEEIHADEVENFKAISIKSPFSTRQTGSALFNEEEMYEGFLKSLQSALLVEPENVLLAPVGEDMSPAAVEVAQPAVSRTVFIVHGHDEPNRLRLEEFLRERWHLDPIVLMAEPGKGRTLIEKFEQEAQRAAYAIVIFTPDDLVEVSGTKYTQARPNAIFELGWFYGRLGRERVCILFRKGTKIPSDLDGITRIEFEDSIDEKTLEIEKELREAGLL